MSSRRAFITLLGGAVAAWPLAARAQQAERMRRIGVLTYIAADDAEGQARHAAFTQALGQLGWSEGRNLRIDGWASEPDQRPARTIAVFLGRRYLGWGACGVARPDVAQAVAATLRYSGFVFRFNVDAAQDRTARPRLFVLSPDGRAGELLCSL